MTTLIYGGHNSIEVNFEKILRNYVLFLYVKISMMFYNNNFQKIKDMDYHIFSLEFKISNLKILNY